MISVRDLQPTDAAPDPERPERIVAYEGVISVATTPGARSFGLPSGDWITVIVHSAKQAAADLARYTPSSATSPSAGDSRIIARMVLDALGGE
jgi:hypothetical protein